MKKLICMLILFVILPSVLADGMIIDRIGPVLEKQQLVAINYENGLQKMILTIQTDKLRSDKSVWIFPVPAKPNDIVIDVVTQFPRFYGKEVTQEAKNNLEGIFKLSSLSQIYPFFFFFIGGTFGAMESKGLAETMTGVRLEKGETVTVYEHIEKEGITTELLGAETGLDLYVYLKRKGLEVPMQSLDFLRDYTHRDYTFVVSWISNLEQVQTKKQQEMYYPYYGGRVLGVEIMFPTDKIYFPLVPTSIYGSEKVPVKIYVLDFVKPELYKELEGFTKVGYYKGSSERYYYTSESGLESFYGDQTVTKYTVIDIINAPSKYLKEDLWIVEGSPGKVKYANFINALFGNELISILIWLVLISMLTGLIAGKIIFKEGKKFALVGLANCFSIIGLIIATIFIKVERIDPALKRKLKEAGLITIGGNFGKKIIFIVLFSVLFLILSWLISLVLKLPL